MVIAAKRRMHFFSGLLSLMILIAAIPVSAQTIDERLAVCLACHGATGQSIIPEVPSLGGQPAFFLTVQLLMFREKMRNVEPMTAMMKSLSDDDLRRMAAALANLPAPRPSSDTPDPARQERARALVQQHRCDFCHNQDFSGAEGAPRLAGQREDYLVKALREYKSNTRRAYDAAMADVIFPLTDADILDLAHYLARLR